jgi:hypothetical protein
VRRLAAVVVTGLMGLLAVYLVGMNVLLRTRLLRNLLSSDPGSLRVEYASAYSPWPGVMRVDGLTIIGGDSNVQWILRLDHCEFHAMLGELLHKRFHVGPVAGDGLSFRVRRRVPSVPPGEMVALPPVPGFADPPLAGPPPPPLTDASYNLWSVRLDAVDATHVREIWIDTLRFTGDMEVHGRWLFRPLRWLEVGPAVIELHPATLAYGMLAPWVSGAVGRLDVTVHPVDIRSVTGPDIVDWISVLGDVGGRLEPADSVQRMVPTVHMQPVDTAIEAHVLVDHGVIRPATRLRVAPFEAVAGTGELSVRASVEATAEVDASGRGRVAIAAASVTAAHDGADVARLNTTEFAVTSKKLDLARPFSDASFALDVQGARTESLPYWTHRWPLPAGVEIQSGAATASASAVGMVAAKTATGRVEVVATGVRLRVVGQTIAGDFHGGLHARRDGGRTEVSASARGAGIDASLELLDGRSQAQWVLLLDLGLLVAGIGSEEGKTSFVLLGARHWFAERASRLKLSGIRE